MPQNTLYTHVMTHKNGKGLLTYSSYQEAKKALLARAKQMVTDYPECCPIRVVNDEIITKDGRGWKIARVTPEPESQP